jgi:parvulin-like peptidyl-prolyl isomerase
VHSPHPTPHTQTRKLWLTDLKTAVIIDRTNFDVPNFNVLSLSNYKIEFCNVVGYLKSTFQIKEICQQVLYQQIIHQAAEKKGITVTTKEIQAAGDRWRHENRLEKAADTFAWLTEQMLSVEELEAGIRDRLLANKLAHALFDSEINSFFIQHRLEFDQVLLYQLIVAHPALAKELRFQIEEREISFFEAAHLYDQDENRRHQCGYEGMVYRWNLKPEIAALMSAAAPGTLLGPLQTEQGYHLFWVKEVIPAQLTPELHQSILDEKFQTWLRDELNHLLHHTV